MFGDIHAGGQRMLTLVNGLLDVSKMDSTVGSLALQARDLIALAAGDLVLKVDGRAIKVNVAEDKPRRDDNGGGGRRYASD